MKSIKKLSVGILFVVTLILGIVSCEQASEPEVYNERAGEIYSTGIVIDDVTYAKTGEVIVIAEGETWEIYLKDNSSWKKYLPENKDVANCYKGVFIKDRKVTLSPFAMSQYEVTQQLYSAVMDSNPSCYNADPDDGENQDLRPVEKVSHYQAIAFCNELTKKTMTDGDVVYFSDEEKTIPYTKENAGNKVVPYMDIDKKGYRLPTEAEWEYAARGANPKKSYWKNAFGTVNTKDNAYIYENGDLLEDENLLTVAWCFDNAGMKTHEVGLMPSNKINIYDMIGNVWEWCWDWYKDKVSTEAVTNPCGPDAGNYRVMRGGAWCDSPYCCAVSYRDNYGPDKTFEYLGFRVVRSIK